MRVKLIVTQCSVGNMMGSECWEFYWPIRSQYSVALTNQRRGQRTHLTGWGGVTNPGIETGNHGPAPTMREMKGPQPLGGQDPGIMKLWEISISILWWFSYCTTEKLRRGKSNTGLLCFTF